MLLDIFVFDQDYIAACGYLIEFILRLLSMRESKQMNLSQHYAKPLNGI